MGRLRYIRQLSMCSHVYPGATHTRFFHSIGTAYLSYSLVKSIRERQPELNITDIDVVCVTLAGLLHDLGHPCFSHMFETFVRRIGPIKSGLSAEEQMRYKKWNHEEASIALVRLVWADLSEYLKSLGLTRRDLEFVCALIDPPKAKLHKAMDEHRLQDVWDNLLPSRPIEKGWMYEIVSNWRSGIDTDKFDYFRRDAKHLGICKEFDHWRYISSVRVIFDDRHGVWTLSPPDKDQDLLREDMLELRRSLHKKAYQHKTTQKLEQHMIDILLHMEHAGLTVRGAGGKALSLSEAAVNLDTDAYVQLTDNFIEARLFEYQVPESPLRAAYDEYDRRIIRRHMFRLLADFNVPSDVDFSVYSADEIISRTLKTYRELHEQKQMRRLIELPESELLEGPEALDPKLFRCHVAEFHMGMRRQNPLQLVLFHSSKNPQKSDFLQTSEVMNALTQKVFLFFDGGREAHDGQLMRQLMQSFWHWAKDVPTRTAVESAAPGSPSARPAMQPARLEHTPQKKRRRLQMQSSCPDAYPP